MTAVCEPGVDPIQQAIVAECDVPTTPAPSYCVGEPSAPRRASRCNSSLKLLDSRTPPPVSPVLPPVVAEVLRSPEGRRWIEHLLLVLVLVCVVHAGLGVRSVRLVLKFAGLAAEIACSERTLHRLATQVRAKIVAWEQDERARLSASMIERFSVLLLDEHFHGGQHLCAVDAASGFVLLEKRSATRSASSWTKALGGALCGLSLRVVALCSDGARGIRGLTIAEQSVPCIADLFHVQRDIGRRITGTLARRCARADAAVDRAKAKLRKNTGADRDVPLSERTTRTGEALAQTVSLAEKTQAEAYAQREDFRAIVREVGAAVHPIDPATGFWNTADQVKATLGKLSRRLAKWGESVKVDERMSASVLRFRRNAKSLVRGVSLWRSLAEQAMDRLVAASDVRQMVLEQLVPYAYVLRHHRRTERASERESSGTTLQLLRAKLMATSSVWRTMEPSMRRPFWKFADEVASMLVRSSSAVEGANSRSALWHHQRGRIDEAENAARVVMQNYVIEDEDGRTAAHRFFGRAPRSLLLWLRAEVVMPGPPRCGHPSSRREDYAADLLAAV
jgi:hypothetical protein